MGRGSSSVKSVRFSPDETKLVAGGFDDKIRVCLVDDGERLLTVQTPGDGEAGAWHPSGRWFRGGGHWCEIAIDDAETGERAGGIGEFATLFSLTELIMRHLTIPRF